MGFHILKLRCIGSVRRFKKGDDAMDQMVGKQSVIFKEPVKIMSYAAAGGKKEGEGPIGNLLDFISEDPLIGKDNWEEGESEFLYHACDIAIKKAGLTSKEVRMAFCGDLLGQMIASSFGFKELGIPFYGVYGACSSIGAALSVAAMSISGGGADTVLAACSSHFASAEKEFRFPLGYGNQRPYSATWTVTGAGAFLLSHKKGKSQIKGFTTGKIKDYGMKDPFNMGACMAPAAADTIDRALRDFGKTPKDFDQIITGDLGSVGQQLLFDLLMDNQVDIRENHIDCGMQIYDSKDQDTHAGGSGCACSALMLSAEILPKIDSGEWKNVLFVPTGALLSQVSANEGRTIPAIAHAVWIQTKQENRS